jgi:hypothetical protein
VERVLLGTDPPRYEAEARSGTNILAFERRQLLSTGISSVFLGDMTSMSEEKSVAVGADNNNNMKVANPHWPLAYSLQLPKPNQSSLQSYGFSSNQASPRPWWSHRLYRGPGGKEVEILYSRSKAESERIVQHFLNGTKPRCTICM